MKWNPEFVARLNQIIRGETKREADRHMRAERLAVLELRRKLSDSVYLEVLRKEGRA